MPNRTIIVLRSALGLVLAIAAIPVVNLAGGELAGVLALPRGGDARLAYDLLWVFLAGVVGSVLMVGVAAVSKTAHAWACLLYTSPVPVGRSRPASARAACATPAACASPSSPPRRFRPAGEC